MVKSVSLDGWRSMAMERVSPLFFFCALGLISSLLLGGGTRSGFLSDAILQLSSIPVFAASAWRIEDVSNSQEMRRALWFCGALLAIPLFQLIPLPPAIWTQLPERDTIVSGFKLLDRDLPWAPVSMSPNRTWLSALSLFPPLSLFLGVIQLSCYERRCLTLVALAIGLLSGILGMMQVAQGTESPLRFFEYTNSTEAVGFFANRNHFAALLYTLMLFAAAWAAGVEFTDCSARDKNTNISFSIIAILGSLCLLMVFLAAQVIARSRAGLALTVVASLSAFVIGRGSRNMTGCGSIGRVLIGAVALVFLLSTQFALFRILDRFDAVQLTNGRIAFARNTIEAATATMPFGAGLGAFIPMYAMFEKPRDLIAGAYANHAHNDFLEMWLETGVIGLILLGIFIIWLINRSLEIWRKSQAVEFGVDQALSRASTVIIALLLAHSLVDYPLRTGALMAVFAFSCALLVEPSKFAGDERSCVR
jgi:O-antigen ligase